MMMLWCAPMFFDLPAGMRVLFWKNAAAFLSVVTFGASRPPWSTSVASGDVSTIGGIDVDVLEVAAAGLAAGDDALDRLRVPAKLRERRAEGLAPLRVPLGAVDIDEPARALHVDEEDGVRRDDCDVDFEGLAVAQDLEVVQDEVARRQVIPQVRDSLPFGLVHRLANGDHRGHQFATPFSILASSGRLRFTLERWHASSAKPAHERPSKARVLCASRSIGHANEPDMLSRRGRDRGTECAGLQLSRPYSEVSAMSPESQRPAPT
jgi:hypothetical protein